MDTLELQPKGLVKRLVGQYLEVSLSLNPRRMYEVELFSTINREKKSYRFEKQGNLYVVRVMLIKSGFFTWQVRFRKQGTKRWLWLKDKHNRKVTGDVQVDPAWLSQAIVYNVFVRFFKGRPGPEEETSTPKDQKVLPLKLNDLPSSIIAPGEGGTFDDVKAYLDTMRKLKITVLYFNPIHIIGELYRGYNMMDQLPGYLQPGSPYSVKDYKSIDPELTYDRDTKRHLLSDPQQEFKDLIDAAHERGMFIVMDLVFNHTAHDFVLQRIKPEWYLYKENITSLEDPYLYPEDVKSGKPWGDPKHSMAPFDHGTWWSDCAQLNWEYKLPEGPNDPPPNYSLKEMWEYFKSIPRYWIRHFGVDGFRCDVAYRVPPAFWKACIAEAREEAAQRKNNISHDVIFIAESYTNDLKELQESGFSAVYGDFSHKLQKPVDLKGYLDYIYNLSGDFFPEGSRWFHFPESHDFGKSAQKVLGEAAGRNPDAAQRVNQSRWLLTATLPGVPLIFNGFEKVEWRPINIMSYGAVNWDRHTDLKDFISRVNEIRHHSPALQKGSYVPLETNQGLTDSTQLFAFLRQFNDETWLVVVNMDVYQKAGPAIVYLTDAFTTRYRLEDMLTNQVFDREGKELVVELEPGQGHLFRVYF